MTQKLDIDTKYPGLREQLGRQQDPVLATEYGITASRVGQIRNALGVAAATTGTKPRGTFVHGVFRCLRDRWEAAAQAKGRTTTRLALAADLNISKPGRLSEWATGSSGRRPTWETLVRLAGLTGCTLTLDTKGVTINGAKRGDSDRVVRGAGEAY